MSAHPIYHDPAAGILIDSTSIRAGSHTRQPKDVESLLIQDFLQLTPLAWLVGSVPLVATGAIIYAGLFYGWLQWTLVGVDLIVLVIIALFSSKDGHLIISYESGAPTILSSRLGGRLSFKRLFVIAAAIMAAIENQSLEAALANTPYKDAGWPQRLRRPLEYSVTIRVPSATKQVIHDQVPATRPGISQREREATKTTQDRLIREAYFWIEGGGSTGVIIEDGAKGLAKFILASTHPEVYKNPNFRFTCYDVFPWRQGPEQMYYYAIGTLLRDGKGSGRPPDDDSWFQQEGTAMGKRFYAIYMREPS